MNTRVGVCSVCVNVNVNIEWNRNIVVYIIIFHFGNSRFCVRSLVVHRSRVCLRSQMLNCNGLATATRLCIHVHPLARSYRWLDLGLQAYHISSSSSSSLIWLLLLVILFRFFLVCSQFSYAIFICRRLLFVCVRVLVHRENNLVYFANEKAFRRQSLACHKYGQNIEPSA